MTGYRFHVSYDGDSETVWRDIVAGANCTLATLQSTLNDAVGLDEHHLWFFGLDSAYWNSQIKYQRPEEFEEENAMFDETTEDADATTLAAVVERHSLDSGDDICYLYDYGDEWRFVLTLDAIDDSVPDDHPPEVTDSNGEELEQYDSAVEAQQSLPHPLDELLPDGPVPKADVRELESRDDVVHTLVLVEYDDADQRNCERFAVQYEETAYLVEYFPYGWEVVRRVTDEDASESALLDALADAIRDWHDEITRMVEQTVDDEYFGPEKLSMDDQLDRELDRIRE